LLFSSFTLILYINLLDDSYGIRPTGLPLSEVLSLGRLSGLHSTIFIVL
jgi:hypothetical protein